MTAKTSAQATVRLERAIPATPHQVYRAWLDPSLLRRWMAAGGLVPDERLMFRWGFVGPDRAAGPSFDSLLTVTLREAPDGGTMLTLVHERLDVLAAAMPQVAENVGPGWDSALGKLAAIVPA